MQRSKFFRDLLNFTLLVCPHKFHDARIFFLQVFQDNVDYSMHQTGNKIFVGGRNAAFNYDVAVIVDVVFENLVGFVELVDVFHHSSAICFFNNCCSNTNLHHYIDAVVNNNHSGQVLTVNFHKGTVQNGMHFVFNCLCLEAVNVVFLQECVKFSYFCVHWLYPLT